MGERNDFSGAGIILAFALGVAAMIWAAGHARGEGWNGPVTATVTPEPTKFWNVQDTPVYEVFVTNNKTHNSYPWQLKTFPSQEACVAALGNIPAYLAGISVGTVPPVEYNDKVDKQLGVSVDALTFTILQNTGQLPDLSIGCRAAERKGRPA